MTIKKLINSVPVLQKLARMELPLGTLYNISRTFTKLEEHLKFYEDQKNILSQKYCKIIDGQIVPNDENKKIFEKEFNELLEFEIDMSEIPILKLHESDNIHLSYNDYEYISEFVEII